MATLSSQTVQWNNFNSSTLQAYDSTVYDGVFNSNALLKLMEGKKKSFDGGRDIVVPIEHSVGNGGPYTGFQKLDPSDKEIVTTAVFDICDYEVDVTIAKTDWKKNRGPGMIFDLVEAKTKNAIKTMKYNLTTDMFSTGGTATSGATKITGLLAQVPKDPDANPSWGNVGGIDRSVAANSYYRAITDTLSSVADFTLGAVNDVFGEVWDDNEKPDVIVTTQAIWNKIWAQADTKQRLGTENMASLGYVSINFNETPIIVDKACPTGCMFMLNLNSIYLKVDSTDDMTPTQWLMPTNQMAQVKYYTWSGNLVCANPRRNALIYY